MSLWTKLIWDVKTENSLFGLFCGVSATIWNRLWKLPDDHNRNENNQYNSSHSNRNTWKKQLIMMTECLVIRKCCSTYFESCVRVRAWGTSEQNRGTGEKHLGIVAWVCNEYHFPSPFLLSFFGSTLRLFLGSGKVRIDDIHKSIIQSEWSNWIRSDHIRSMELRHKFLEEATKRVRFSFFFSSCYCFFLLLLDQQKMIHSVQHSVRLVFHQIEKQKKKQRFECREKQRATSFSLVR